MTNCSSEAFVSDWEQTLNRIIIETEQSELDLVSTGQIDADVQRKESGSYYTPEDVADHFWLLFFRFHQIEKADDLRRFIDANHLVEPSAGSGIFLFTFFRQALRLGLSISELASIQFSIVDINFKALNFVRHKLKDLETAIGFSADGIGFVQNDFIDWIETTKFENVVFVGNPPYVSNASGSKWRNLYADFVEAMLSYPAKSTSLSLILPISICFSRHYADLRQMVLDTQIGVSIASYDNIPNALFKSGKPESKNSNKSNSQRCVIIHAGGPNRQLRETTALLRWKAVDRAAFLDTVPDYHGFSCYEFDDQFPRFVDRRMSSYLNQPHDLTISDLISPSASPKFSVAGAARNFIGIRNYSPDALGVIPIGAPSKEVGMMLLQILGSPVFLDYWRSLGDGFHVTKRNVYEFPISNSLMEKCERNLVTAGNIWRNRARFQKTKLNCGKLIDTYDFTNAFDYLEL